MPSLASELPILAAAADLTAAWHWYAVELTGQQERLRLPQWSH